MAARNFRHLLLSLILLGMVFVGVYFLTSSVRDFRVTYLFTLIFLIYTGLALNRARTVVSPPRLPIFQDDPKILGLPLFEEVNFNSTDGIDLSGWYIPHKNSVTVILVHSLGGNRLQMRHHARILSGNGFGVLMFDLRAHARSAGAVTGFGWIEHQDLLGAYDYLIQKPEVDRVKIGVAGLSLGSQIAVRAAAHSNVFAALWLDSPIPVVYQEHFFARKKNIRQLIFAPWWWLAHKVQAWLIQTPAPRPVFELIGGISPTQAMVVASGADRLLELSRRLYEFASEPRQFWQLDDIQFGSGILEYGDVYDLKLIEFFNQLR